MNKRLARSVAVIALGAFLLAGCNKYTPKKENADLGQNITSQAVVLETEKEPEVKINEIWVVKDTGFEVIDCALPEHLQAYTFYMCDKYELDYKLIMAQMKIESDYNQDLISSTNDYGLMQINECNHEWLTKVLGITDYLDPYQSIKAGTYVMSKLMKSCDGNVNKALMAYNMGYEAADFLWQNGEHSTRYTRKIQKEIERLKNEELR